MARDLEATSLAADEAEAEDEGENEEPSFFADPKRLLQTFAIVVVLVVAIYVLLPNLVGLDDAIEKLGQADAVWLVVGLAFTVLMFFSYVALFRGVVGEGTRLNWRESYEITLAGLAATRLFSAGGAGGIVLTYWALRKAGMVRREAANRMTAFLILLYAVYLITVVVDGILLRTGLISGSNPPGLTVVPAAIAGGIIVLFLGVSLLPADLERRMARFAQGYRYQKWARRLASVPATIATGVRVAITFAREPSRGGLALIGAIGFWAANIGILWASFHAYHVEVPLGVVVMGFFIGMVANLFPFAPGGVGAVDAGMIGTFVLFGLDGASVFAAILSYRLMAFWLPIPPGIVAFFQLRQTVNRWDEQKRLEGKSRPASGFVPAITDPTSESKV
jgi:putative heme transporter